MNAQLIAAQNTRAQLMRRLEEIDAAQQSLEGGGVIIAACHGYISGNPYLFSTDVNRAFVFANHQQAEQIIQEFGAVLEKPQIVRVRG